MKRLSFLLLLLAAQTIAAQSTHPKKLLLRDEGLSQLSYINLEDSSANWHVSIPTGRDMQLTGKGRVLIGTGNGYEERDIRNGNKLYELTKFPGTISARRLKNGNTMLVGINWQDKKGIVLVEVNDKGEEQGQIVYPGFSYVRLIRETPKGSFLITANDTVFEGSIRGEVFWTAKISSQKPPHAWQALRLANGQTVVSGGYAGNFQFFSPEGVLVKTITGPDEVKPNFYAGYQILPNGNFVAINWQGHGANMGEKGTQLLEYNPEGKLVWSWKQDARKFSSLHAVIVLDGLDTEFLHVENGDGVLAPVK